MPVRGYKSRQTAWLQERDRRRHIFEATGQGRKWLEENDREWLEHYLLNLPRARRYYSPRRIGYY